MYDKIIEGIWQLVLLEIERQNTKWGDKRNLAPCTWITIMAEEFGEVARANLEEDDDGYVEELIQVAAVCIQAVRAYYLQQISTKNNAEMSKGGSCVS